MYMDDIKLFAKRENELESVIQALGMHNDNIGMECTMLIKKNEKRQMMQGIELTNKIKSERSKNRKFTNTWEYWKQTQSNTWI